MKKYGYTFKGSPLAHQHPLSSEEVLRQVQRSIDNGFNALTPEDFQVYELVSVKVKVVTKLEII